MNKLITIGLVAALSGTALAASAQDTMTEAGMDMKNMDMKPMGVKTMDANRDGLISKDEFTKHHEAMWENMKKDSKGSVSLKDMEAMHDAKTMKK